MLPKNIFTKLRKSFLHILFIQTIPRTSNLLDHTLDTLRMPFHKIIRYKPDYKSIVKTAITFIKNNILTKHMEEKKKVTILVVIALILAITAIVLNASDSEIPTTKDSGEVSSQGGELGVDILPVPIEDKLTEDTGASE